MKTTRHVLHHRAGFVTLSLDEGSGELVLRSFRFRAPHLPAPDVRRDIDRWLGRIACGWAKRTGSVAGSVVSVHFSNLSKGIGRFQIEQSTTQ